MARRNIIDGPEPEDHESDLDFLGDGSVRPENGVNVSWLCQAFGVSRRTVINRLAGVRPIRLGARHAPIYSIADAAPRLVKAEINYLDALKNMRPQDLPPMLQAVFWDAMIKKLDWEKKAKHLWHTSDVLDVLTDLFGTIRVTMQLWPEELEKAHKLSDEQLNFVRAQVDSLQGQLYEKMTSRAKLSQTGPVSDLPPDAVEADDE
jgi:hypothetical protein